MGALTRAELVDEGTNLAGNSSLTTRANTWFNAWLRSQYRAWPWPFLQKRVSGVPLASASSSLLLGVGSGGVALEIQRIIDPVQIHKADYSGRGLVRIRQSSGSVIQNWDESTNNPATNLGMPQVLKVVTDTVWGRWVLYPWPIPDVAYLLSFDYFEQPADMVQGSVGDVLVPIYPNDRTMIQAVYVDALKYESAGEDSSSYRAELEVLAAMVRDDRLKYGEVPGTNDRTNLDSTVYR